MYKLLPNNVKLINVVNYLGLKDCRIVSFLECILYLCPHFYRANTSKNTQQLLIGINFCSAQILEILDITTQALPFFVV